MTTNDPLPPAARIRVAANAVVLRGDECLLIEYDGDGTGRHYNLPGGGIEPGERLLEGLEREVREEACLDIEVGRLLLVVESVASANTNQRTGSPRNELRFIFQASCSDPSAARMPDRPDNDFQCAVVWRPISMLPELPLLPQVGREIQAALAGQYAAPVVVPNPHK